MDRRQATRSDNSNTSVTDSLKDLYLGISQYIFGDGEMSTVKPEVLLSRMLSTKTAISTTSSLAEENQRARDMVEQRMFVQVGKGQCGTIYALKGTTTVIKIPNSPQKVDELFRDFQTHDLVSRTFQNLSETLRASCNINVPKIEIWTDPVDSVFWSYYGPRFTGNDTGNVAVPNYGLVSERIWPLSLPVRSAIVDALCPREIKKRKEDFLRIPENKDCLIRIYLGRQQKDTPMTPGNVRLRNFPLHIDQIESLGLNAEMYAMTMAQALAVLHWNARIDANDVEFVLGSSPKVSLQPSADQVSHATKDTAKSLYVHDFQHRTVAMWLIDFNQCAKFNNDESGLKKLVDGFWWNDPYYPRPGDKLWSIFVNHYLKISGEFEKSSMPKAFIDKVVAVGKQRSGGGLFG